MPGPPDPVERQEKKGDTMIRLRTESADSARREG
jgi:hypothetical protein